ncbi:MAG: hypothetical protein KUL82_13040 [Bdellovibrio sp.]|nr:hypothetical protein [Bdellovibrio sp.]
MSKISLLFLFVILGCQTSPPKSHEDHLKKLSSLGFIQNPFFKKEEVSRREPSGNRWASLATLPNVSPSSTTPTQTKFFLGVSGNGGQCYDQIGRVSSSDHLLISGAIEPQASDVGREADVFIVVVLQGATSFMRVGDGWEIWDGHAESLKPIGRKALASREETVLFEKPPSDIIADMQGHFYIYVGYRLVNQQDILFAGTEMYYVR